MLRNIIFYLTSICFICIAIGCGGKSSSSDDGPDAIWIISGTLSGDISDNVIITLSGDADAAVQTDSSGNFEFTALVNGSYTVTPSESGYTFSPHHYDIDIANADQTGQDFTSASTAATHTITVVDPADGTISPNGSFSVSEGASQTFTISPYSGYGIDAVVINDTVFSGSTSYTINNITEDQTVEAIMYVTGGGSSDDAIAGTVEAGLATAECASVRWEIAGDADADAVVELRYRINGQSTWKRGMDLRRANRTYQEPSMLPPAGYYLHAGSLFNLTPNTLYDIRLDLIDPDGGFAREFLSAQTWQEPTAPAPLRTLHVVPGSGGGSGTSGDPYQGIAEADTNAQPGDLILLHSGSYVGGNTINTSGTEANPIVWKSAPSETVVLDGVNSYNPVLGISSEHDIIIEDITLRRGSHLISIFDSYRITLRRLTMTESEYFVYAGDGDNYRFWISDCDITGSYTWPRAGQSGEERGIQVAGEGHVVCHNTIINVWDGIDTANFHPVRDIDICYNDISVACDDGIELDFSDSNVRAFKNRLTNCYQGISFQPIKGGPAYAVRNALYNIEVEPFKLHSNGGTELSGAVILHNSMAQYNDGLLVATSVPIHDVLMLNNAYAFRYDSIPYAFEVGSPVDNCFFDYDVFCGPVNKFGKLVDDRYDTIALFAAGTGYEANGTYNSDRNSLYAAAVTIPWDEAEKYAPATYNQMQLKTGSTAIDTGTVLPNINDGYNGSAPDAGCCEYGDSLPAYGVR